MHHISNFAYEFIYSFAPFYFQFRTVVLFIFSQFRTNTFSISHYFIADFALLSSTCLLVQDFKKKILNFSSLLNFALRTSDTLCIALERTWFFNKNHNTILIEIIFGLLLSFTVTLLLFDFYYHGYLFRFYWHCWDRVQDDQRKKCGWE